MSRTRSRLKSEDGISLETIQRKWASSRFEGRISWFFSRCSRKLGVPLKLRLGHQGPAQVASGKSSLHESCDGPLGIPLQSVQGPRSSSRLDAGTSGFLKVQTWISGLLWSFNRGVMPRLAWREGSPLSSRAAKVVSDVLIISLTFF